jgi:hypothetical protein
MLAQVRALTVLPLKLQQQLPRARAVVILVEEDVLLDAPQLDLAGPDAPDPRLQSPLARDVADEGGPERDVLADAAQRAGFEAQRVRGLVVEDAHGVAVLGVVHGWARTGLERGEEGWKNLRAELLFVWLVEVVGVVQ